MNAIVKPRVRVGADGSLRGTYNDKGAYVSYSGTRRDAARFDLSEFAGWNPPIGFDGADRYRERQTITGRSRDLDANNGWINGGLDRRVEAVIGGQIKLSAQPVYQLLGRDFEWRMNWTADVQPRFRVWANDVERRCDTRRRLSFGALTKLAYLSYLRDGAALAEIRTRNNGAVNPTNVLLIEPERLSQPKGQVETRYLRGGIEMDDDGAPVAYHIRKRHPHDPAPGLDNFEWERIAARGPTGRAKIVHVFSPRRVEQLDGISRLAEIMVPAKMLDRVDRAEVDAALKSALLSIFIKSPGTTDDLEAMMAPSGDDGDLSWMRDYAEYRGKNPIQVPMATVRHLLPGEDIETPDRTSPNSNYPDFARFILQKVAGSLGISYPQLSQDWAGINYSSARALLNELWRSFLEDRHFFTQQFCTPIYAAWLEWEVANGTVKVPGGPANFYRNKTAICTAEWIGPGRGSVDPLKEANAHNLDIASGRMSTIEAILERGRDPTDVLMEERHYGKQRDALGLDPVNNNVKAVAGGGDGGSEGGGTEDDRDGDGVAQEDVRRRRQQQEGDEQ